MRKGFNDMGFCGITVGKVRKSMLGSEHALFNTVPKNDHCHFFDGGKPNVEKVINFLDYKKQDVAAATNIPVKSIRYDHKMPSELRERSIEWATAINLVVGFFDKDMDKTTLWFSMTNPLLGDRSPRDMIRIGRFKKLLKFILTALEENKRG